MARGQRLPCMDDIDWEGAGVLGLLETFSIVV